MSTLYIVPTPVGNMGDMTPRAIEVLKGVDVILAEDTRTSSKLLKRYDISTPMISHHKYNEHETVNAVAERLEQGHTVALISDAGTPGISDPGFMLARVCRQRDIPVITLPGATAFVPALVNSGLPCDRFTFQGFLPVKKGRSERLSEIAVSPVSSVVYESPVRVLRTLRDLGAVCGDEREISVSREISKQFEQTLRTDIKGAIAHFEANEPRGEFVMIVAPGVKRVKKVHRNKYKDVDEDMMSSDEDEM